jgi:DNA-binding FadR family transcriptional regulator
MGSPFAADQKIIERGRFCRPILPTPEKGEQAVKNVIAAFRRHMKTITRSNIYLPVAALFLTAVLAIPAAAQQQVPFKGTMLKVLQVMGLLEARQGSGNYVSENAPAILQQPTDLLVPLRGLSFAELFEARRAMEAEAAACAALRATEADLQKLKRVVEQMRAVLGDPVAYVKADIQFHRNIAQAAGNAVFLWFFDLISKALYYAWLARAREGSTERTLAEHEEITAAILQRKDEVARGAMLRHLMLSKYYAKINHYANQWSELEFRVVATPKPIGNVESAGDQSDRVK